MDLVDYFLNKAILLFKIKISDIPKKPHAVFGRNLYASFSTQSDNFS